jgi:hypothetical protein
LGEEAFYNSPASLEKNLTPQIVDRLFNTYQRDLPRQVDYMDEVERWKIRWALVDEKPETTRHSACNKPSIYTIISIILTMSVSSATSEISFSAIRLVKSFLR